LGLDYISFKDPAALEYILSQPHAGIINRINIEKTLRLHAVATGLMMALNAGAEILPDRKPSLMPPITEQYRLTLRKSITTLQVSSAMAYKPSKRTA